ncbi:hypothetical protein WKI13_14565 [Teredinibacter turnerae]|uniref:hypothetical protein n=1 Tax=Teredinibacter turnerae TaxID=2426 RepID=UPI000363D120|nr:hypothetical protein [Teredinibacter turnerae]
MIRNELAKKHKTISIWSASITFAALSFPYKTATLKTDADESITTTIQILLNKTGFIDPLITFVMTAVGTSVFILTFKVLLSLYSRVFWRLRCPTGYLGGKWHLFYDVYENSYDGTTNSKRFERHSLIGEADIYHSIEGVTINARSFDTNTETLSADAKSLWTTNSSNLFYEIINGSMVLSNQKGQSVGTMILHIVPNDSRNFTFKSLQTTEHSLYSYLSLVSAIFTNFIIFIQKLFLYLVTLLREVGYLSPSNPRKISGHYSFVIGPKLTQGRITLIKKGSNPEIDEPRESSCKSLSRQRIEKIRNWGYTADRENNVTASYSYTAFQNIKNFEFRPVQREPESAEV